jgi:hypothetical protein
VDEPAVELLLEPEGAHRPILLFSRKVAKITGHLYAGKFSDGFAETHIRSLSTGVQQGEIPPSPNF